MFPAYLLSTYNIPFHCETMVLVLIIWALLLTIESQSDSYQMFRHLLLVI